MGLLDIFKKKNEEPEGKHPFSVKTSLSPVRITSHKMNSVDLHLKMKNLSKDSTLTSIMIQVPKGLGLDQSGIAKAKEIRIGYLANGEEKDLSIPVWGNVMTEPGDYKISVEIFCHYRTFAYIQNSVKVHVELRAV